MNTNNNGNQIAIKTFCFRATDQGELVRPIMAMAACKMKAQALRNQAEPEKDKTKYVELLKLAGDYDRKADECLTMAKLAAGAWATLSNKQSNHIVRNDAAGKAIPFDETACAKRALEDVNDFVKNSRELFSFEEVDQVISMYGPKPEKKPEIPIDERLDKMQASLDKLGDGKTVANLNKPTLEEFIASKNEGHAEILKAYKDLYNKENGEGDAAADAAA